MFTPRHKFHTHIEALVIPRLMRCGPSLRCIAFAFALHAQLSPTFHIDYPFSVFEARLSITFYFKDFLH